MSEKKLVVDQLKFTYEGIFDLNGLYRIIDSFFYEKGYDRFERMNTEQVTPAGRQITIETIPFKNITDYFRMHVRIRIKGNDIRKMEVDQDGAKVALNQGGIMVVFDGYIESDRQDRWEKTPFTWFLRTIFDKYIFKGHYIKAEQWLVSDLEDVYARIRSFLNVYRSHPRGTVTPYVLA